MFIELSNEIISLIILIGLSWLTWYFSTKTKGYMQAMYIIPASLIYAIMKYINYIIPDAINVAYALYWINGTMIFIILILVYLALQGIYKTWKKIPQ